MIRLITTELIIDKEIKKEIEMNLNFKNKIMKIRRVLIDFK